MQKMGELEGAKGVSIPVHDVGDINGEKYFAVSDGHHTMEAAKRLGIPVKYEYGVDSEGLTGDALLEGRYIDSPWYDVETGRDVMF